jgi:hypothetical protein
MFIDASPSRNKKFSSIIEIGDLETFPEEMREKHSHSYKSLSPILKA